MKFAMTHLLQCIEHRDLSVMRFTVADLKTLLRYWIGKSVNQNAPHKICMPSSIDCSRIRNCCVNQQAQHNRKDDPGTLQALRRYDVGRSFASELVARNLVHAPDLKARYEFRREDKDVTAPLRSRGILVTDTGLRSYGYWVNSLIRNKL